MSPTDPAQQPAEQMERLQRLPPSTRFRIEAKLRQLHQRRTGRPLRV